MSTAAPEVEKRRRGLRFSRPTRWPSPRRPAGWRVPARPAGWGTPRILAAVLLAILLLAGLFAAPLTGLLGVKGPNVHDQAAVNIFGNPTGPSGAHPLGVDTEGRDVLSRMLYGLRSLVLLSLAGAALGLMVGQALWALRRLHRGVAVAVQLFCAGLRAFPPLLLGLALGLAIGPGAWRMIVALAVTGIAAAENRRDFGALAVRCLATAMALDFGLTFLGDGLGGTAPQLGGMVARAGEGIVAGVPAWWSLLFPGLLVVVTLVVAWAVVPPDRSRDRLGERVRWTAPTLKGYVLDQAVTAAARVAVVLVLAVVAFTSFADATGPGKGSLAAVGADLSGTVSLLLGGGLVWLGGTVVQIWLATRARRLRGLLAPQGRFAPVRGLGVVPEVLLAAAPAGWLAFLGVYLFSESVGKIPILPGPSTYVGLTHDPARWAHSLILPWLLLGLSAAAITGPGLSAAISAAASSGQQRVARAAGVPLPALAHQLRRGLVGAVLALSGRWLATFLGTVVVIEASFSIPGAGALTVSDFSHAHAATVADVTVLAAVIVVLVELGLNLTRAVLDPRSVL